jgi:TonB family protein
VSPTPFIDRGGLQKFRQALSRVTRSLELILSIRGGYRPGQYKARLAFALAFSLAIHAFLLSLRFGIAGFGLPGLALPWAERRAFTSDLSVRLAEAPRAQNPPAARGKAARRPSAVEPLAVRPPAVRSPAARPPPPRTLVARTPAKSKRVKQRRLRAKAPANAQPVARAALKPLPPVAVARPAAPPAEKPAREPATRLQPELIAQAEPQQETFSVPSPAQGVPEPAPVLEAAAKQQVEEPPPPVQQQAEPARDPVQADQEAALRAREQEAVKLEQARRQEESRLQEETRRREQARAAREALELEALRRAERQAEETARQQAAELARRRALELEARRQEEAKEEANAARRAMEVEALRQAEEAVRQQAAARERQRELEARRAEELAARDRAARELAERQRAEAQAASQRQREAERLAVDSARAALSAAEPGRSAAGTIGSGNPPGRDLAAKALEQLRTPGALRAEPQGPRPSAQFPQPPPASAGADNSRRRSVLGGVERDIGLRMYVESWRWKIERNGSLNYPSGARTRAAENPVVTVAIRRDGSVEDVHIHRSSGQRDLDERVRRIVQLNAPFSAFPPDMARAYDVIEIRRVWIFADKLRIMEELN